MKVQILKSEDLGKVISDARKLQGITQFELAALSGTNRRFISEIERGKETSQIGKVLAVLSTLGVALYGITEW